MMASPLHTMTASTSCFAHAVNSKEKLAAALSDPSVTFLEADVVFWQEKGLAVMGHDPLASASSSSSEHLPVTDFARLIAESGRCVGIKLDMKERATLEQCKQALLTLQAEEKQPSIPSLVMEEGHSLPALMLNADVLSSSCAPQSCKFNRQGKPLDAALQQEEALAFMLECLGLQAAAAEGEGKKESTSRSFPMLSIGWCTRGEGKAWRPEGGGAPAPAAVVSSSSSPAASMSLGPSSPAAPVDHYTAEDIQAMLRLCQQFVVEVQEKGLSGPSTTQAEAAAGAAQATAAVPLDKGSAHAAPVFLTFPVRASFVRESWGQLQRLLKGKLLPLGASSESAASSSAATSAAASSESPCWPSWLHVGLTVWSNVKLPEEEVAWLKATLPADSTFFDLPQ